LATQAKCDYYQILGVGPLASSQEIESAHQKLVAQLRTSDAPEASDHLIDVRKAHMVLADPKKRERYDASLTDAKSVSRRRHDHHSNVGNWFDSVMNLLSLFNR